MKIASTAKHAETSSLRLSDSVVLVQKVTGIEFKVHVLRLVTDWRDSIDSLCASLLAHRIEVHRKEFNCG